MRPADALAYKALLIDQLRHWTNLTDTFKGPLTYGTLAQGLVDALPDATTYFVTDEMTAVAKNAARTMPRQPLRHDDLPTRNGFIIFDAPIAMQTGERDSTPNIPAVAAAWILAPREIIQAGLDAARAKGIKVVEEHVTGDVLQVTMFARVDRDLIPFDLQTIQVGDDWGGEEFRGPWDRSPMVVLRAAFSIMQQTLLGRSLATMDPAQLDRATRRRMARLHLPHALIIVRLRRIEKETEGVSTMTDWTHRWLVTGHWRNQYLPSIQAHRLQWISPYVKGPANRPLILKNRVTAWMR